MLPHEGLPDQRRADNLAVAFYQGPVGLVVQQQLGDPGDDQRVPQPEHDRECEQDPKARPALPQHVGEHPLSPDPRNHRHEQVEQLDTDERHDDAAEAVDQRIPAQQLRRRDRSVADRAGRGSAQ